MFISLLWVHSRVHLPAAIRPIHCSDPNYMIAIWNLRQLEYFVRVSEEANFTRAAQHLHVAQPAVSTQIQRLERELGQPLLDRSQRAVRLTAAGAAALPHAKAALAAALNVQRAVDDTAQLVRGTIRIGTVVSHTVDIATLVAQFHTRYPAVEITLRTNDSDTLIDAVRHAQLDLALIAVGPDEQPEGIATKIVSDEAIVAVVSPNHAWSARSKIALDALQDVPLIALPRGTEIRRQLELSCRRAGFRSECCFRGQHTCSDGRLLRTGAWGGDHAAVSGGPTESTCMRLRSFPPFGPASRWRGVAPVP